MPELSRLQRIAAYGLVHDEAGRLLLCRLCPPEPSAGLWTLPGGGMEWGEHPEETARREIFEETGFEVRIDRLVDYSSHIFEFPDARMHALRFIYEATIVGGSLRYEVEGSTDVCQFFTYAQLEALPMVDLAQHGARLAASLCRGP